MKSGHSFLAWEKGSDTYNYLIGVNKNNFPISVSKKFFYPRSRGDDFSIMGDSDAVVIKDNINDVFDDSEIYISSDYECVTLGQEITLKVTPNYTNGHGLDSWEFTKKNYDRKSNVPSFFIEVSKGSSTNNSVGYDNFTSISVEEAEKLIGFLQNKINYIKGE